LPGLTYLRRNADVALEVQIAAEGFVAWKSKFTERQVEELITESEQVGSGPRLEPRLAI
jgi:hypothetical protein